MEDKRLVHRTNIMARAGASWFDSLGTQHVADVMLEETSPHGASLRLKEPIAIGSKITVRWTREQFSGTVRHYEREGSDYIVGIERDLRARDAR